MERVLKKLEHESLREFYFLAISLILAFGIIQTSGSFLQTDKPVVSVVSCSMYPSLHVGDVLIVRGESYENIEVEDIVVYSIKEASITVGGEDYQINDYNGQERLESSVGEIQLSKVLEDGSGRVVGARISIDGEMYDLRENEAVQVQGTTVTLNEAQGMNIPVVHRVTEKNPEYIQTKGDNNKRQLEFEDRVEPRQVHGKMWFKVPRIGGIKLLVMDIVGFSGDEPLKIDSYPKCSAVS